MKQFLEPTQPPKLVVELELVPIIRPHALYMYALMNKEKFKPTWSLSLLFNLSIGYFLYFHFKE